MAQKHNIISEQPMTTYGPEQGPNKRYRRLRNPSFPAAVWTEKNPLLQKGEIGIESNTQNVKFGDGVTRWNDLMYSMVATIRWGIITGDIQNQEDLVQFIDAAVANETSRATEAEQVLQQNIDEETTARESADNTLQANINSEGETRAQADENLQEQITSNDGDISALQGRMNAAETNISTNTTAIENETNVRESADVNLQSQIDAIVAASDVKDIVGTYAELQSYDTSTLGNNDIIKVLQDSTHNDASTYYRWNATTGVFDYIGAEGPYYTKSEADALLNEKQDNLTTAQQAAVDSGITTQKRTNYDNHLTNYNNPHQVTKAQVGLGNVDNTSDANKPISTATQNALNLKADKANTVNGAPISNEESYFCGTSSTPAATVQKEVLIPSITELKAGQIIVVFPTITSTVANSTIKLNDFDAYPMRYGNAAITTTTDTYVWQANCPSMFYFDGQYWRFVAQGYRQVYSAMSVAEGTTGTATSARLLRADYLKQIIQGTTLTGIDVSTTGVVSATDTITTSIGKLQASKQDNLVSGVNIKTVNGNSLLGGGDITLSSEVAWGNITGTLSDQTDLQNALEAKANSSSLATVATSGSFNDLSNKPVVLVAKQDPTAENNYTWYRKYSDGWVEQGGRVTCTNGGSSIATVNISLAVPTAPNRAFSFTYLYEAGESSVVVTAWVESTTRIVCQVQPLVSGLSQGYVAWQYAGYAA